MLDEKQKQTLIVLSKSQDHAWRTGKEFSSGYGGIWRPIPIPEPFATLIEQGLCEMKIIKGTKPGYGIWAYVLTAKGEVMGRMLE